MVFPNWDDIEKVDGFPKISSKTNEYLFRKFRTFDREHHPKVMASGLWLNNGFSSLDGNELKFMEVIPCNITLK